MHNINKKGDGLTYFSFFLSFFLLSAWFSAISSSTLVFLAAVLLTTDDMARLRAVKAVDTGGDAWRVCPLCVFDFEDQVEGIAEVVIEMWFWLSQ